MMSNTFGTATTRDLPRGRVSGPTIAITIVIGLVTLLVGCSSGTGESSTSRPHSEVVTPTSGAGGESPEASGPTSGDLPTDFPCSLVSDTAVSDLAGGEFTGRQRTARVSEGNVAFDARECVWESAAAEGAPPTSGITQIYLQVATVSDTRSGKVTCHELPNATATIDGLGEGAGWEWTTRNGNEPLGKLRACSDTGLYTVGISGSSTEADLKHIARGLIEQAMAAA